MATVTCVASKLEEKGFPLLPHVDNECHTNNIIMYSMKLPFCAQLSESRLYRVETIMISSMCANQLELIISHPLGGS